jgi:gamma-glutamyltranspeptidase/glutathione hydrolase|tara:strand:+ start:2433 stop:4055 length:1623 start_codon:yes stop_codon:yes gene_type:complete
MINNPNYKYTSRRSVTLGLNGTVATSNPLAANAGLDMLKKGGNAVDAAVCAASVLNVVEPMSTGVGGDVFALVYDSNTKQIEALNGSGRSSMQANIDDLRKEGMDSIPLEGPYSGMAVSVPGCVDAWDQLQKKFGVFSLDTVLVPAIDYSHNGFGVSEITANNWKIYGKKLSINDRCELLPNGRSPDFGERVVLPDLNKTLKCISENGSSYFYEGVLPEKISEYVQKFNGWLCEEDFSLHSSCWIKPISSNYRGFDVWECPPNGQGIAALIALNIVENIDLVNSEIDPVLQLHYKIEAMKIAFKDALWYVADPEKVNIPIQELLSKSYAKKRFNEIKEDSSCSGYNRGNFNQHGDTVYVSVIDGNGNACSLINSLYQGFGTGLVVPETGVALQNRGALFSTNQEHPNFLEPNKRPYNTIIPCMITKNSNLVSSLGVMGGFQQPQGHLQVISNLIDFGMNPQEALDYGRFSVSIENDTVFVEDSINSNIIEALKLKGHSISVNSGFDGGLFGGGQIIVRDNEEGILFGGSDPRKDGMSVSF